MALIEGIDDAIASEYQRVRTELRAAIAHSDYTMSQVAALAGVGERTLRNVLAGAHAAQIDTLMRVAFVLGCRVEIALPEGASSRPFQVVPLVKSGTGSRRSSATSRSLLAGGRSVDGSKQDEHRKRTAPRKPRTSWSRHLAA